ncbi:uncharacterized protein LOC142338129 [Convolutriloba macropyga]|uniref:uncharacterized protein LOC142338129 n=1 Tax=Convolutriloba macropyga TaxID=536237 RepID=UPI003F528DF7
MSSNKNGPESRVRGAKDLPWNRNLRIGTLNVRTLAQSCSLGSLKMDLKKYNLDVLGMQETRLKEQEIDLGEHKLFLIDSWLSTAKARQGGVGIAVTKRLAGSIIEQVALSERVASVKFAAQRRANFVVIDKEGKITLTDHEMVIAEVRFKVVAHKPRSQPKVCSAKLRDEVTREAFCAEVKRHLDESDIVEGV